MGNYRFPNEETCKFCKCTFIPKEGAPTDRCQAHLNMSVVEEKKADMLYTTLGKGEILERFQNTETRFNTLESSIDELADKLDDILLSLHSDKKVGTFKKICKGCGKDFMATAPAATKCDSCKGK